MCISRFIFKAIEKYLTSEAVEPFYCRGRGGHGSVIKVAHFVFLMEL